MGQRIRFTLLTALVGTACAPATGPTETQRLAALVDALQQRLNRAEGRLNDVSERVLLLQSSVHDPAQPASTTPHSAELFQRALKQYQAGKPARAFEDFAFFVSTYPNHPDADSALYWMGQCKFDAEAYTDAIDQYTALANGYPQSSKAPEALFKAGVAFERLKQNDKARAMFARLIAAYPQSASAELARSRAFEDDHAP